MAPVVPFILPALAIGGSIASAGGALMGSMAQGQNAAYQAAVARNNAIVEGYNAVNAEKAGNVAAENAGLKNAQNVARVKTSLAASNVDVNSGSAVSAEQSTREIGLLNEQTVMHNAELQAYGYRVGATSDEAQAKLDESEARQAPIAGILGATGSLLSSAKAFAPGGGTSGTNVNSVLGIESAVNDDYEEPLSYGTAGIGAA